MAGTMNLSRDFRELFECLSSREVRYLVVGGYAVAFHGHPRQDIEGTKVDFIDLASLKVNKRTVGRHQDLADLENLR